MPKWSYNELISFYHKAGCTLLSAESEYENETSRLRWVCGCKNIKTTTVASFKRSLRESKSDIKQCGSCSQIMPYSKVVDLFEKNKCSLVTTLKEYYEKNLGEQSRVRWRCKCSGEQTVIIQAYKHSDSGLCKKCVFSCLTYEGVKKIFADAKCKLLTPSIIHITKKTPLEWECKCKRHNRSSLESFEYTKRCRYCGIMASGGGGVTTEKFRETMLARHGVVNPSQSAVLHQKAQNAMYRAKPYTFSSGRVVKVRGYEPFCLDNLLSEGYVEDDIETIVPTFKYSHLGRDHVYHPDIYIKSENLVIEVKSTYTYTADLKKNLTKWDAVIKDGRDYKFQVRVYHPKGYLIRTEVFSRCASTLIAYPKFNSVSC